MVKIPLNHCQVAVVDDADFERVGKVKWFAWWNKHTNTYYAMRTICVDGKKKRQAMHRVILDLDFEDKRQGDHIDHNTLDNRRENLRIVTSQENQWNRRYEKSGCSWSKHHKKWEAYISVNNRKKSLGLFHTPEEAHSVYLVAKAKYHVIKSEAFASIDDKGRLLVGCELRF